MSGLRFNASKYSVVSYSHTLAPWVWLNCLRMPQRRLYEVTDLNVRFDPRLTLCGLMLAEKLFRKLGFVLRNAKDFRCASSICFLYTSLVRSWLESSSIIWHPHEAKYNLVIEWVQKTFLRYLYMRRYFPFCFSRISSWACYISTLCNSGETLLLWNSFSNCWEGKFCAHY